MALIEITFPFALNISVQPTDIMYASVTLNSQSGTNHPQMTYNTSPVAIGTVTAVDHGAMQVEIDDTGYVNNIFYDPNTNLPVITDHHYLFFSKNRIANTSGIIGYFAETEYRNYSKLQTEMFATAIDYVDSSK